MWKNRSYNFSTSRSLKTTIQSPRSCCRKYFIAVCSSLNTSLILVQLSPRCLVACETSSRDCLDNPLSVLNVLSLGLHRSSMRWIDTASDCVERVVKLSILAHSKDEAL